METIRHTHRYAFHLEMVITFIGLVFVGFGIYDAAFGQWDPVGPNPGANTNNVVQYGGGTNTGTSTGGRFPGTNTPVDQAGTNFNPNAVYNNLSTGTGTGGTTTGGTGTGAGGNQTGGTGTWYGNTGGYFGQPGIADPGAARTQGGYIQTGNGVFYQPGLNEAGAVRTEGLTRQTISTQTDATLSSKHCEFITRYHKFGDRGGDVAKIQTFLKDRGYYNGKIDGVYGVGTFKAVREFQKDYADKVLDPWDISAQKPTGITYISTKYAINKLVGCPDPATIIPKTGRVLNY